MIVVPGASVILEWVLQQADEPDPRDRDYLRKAGPRKHVALLADWTAPPRRPRRA
jgi:hypothetical protein